MKAPDTKAMHEIVKLVFPELRHGGDPDIVRYFELRKEGRLLQALAVYNCSLRARYPDDASRVLLLKLFREGDPRYASCQRSLVLDLASRLSARIRVNIDLITAPLERADLSDALRALKAVESVLARLPGESDEALPLLVRYDRFAVVLGYRETLVRRALDLVREYDAVSRPDSPAEYDFVARSAAMEERRRASQPRSHAGAEERYDFVSGSERLEEKRKLAEKAKRNYFEPDRIKFSREDRDSVEISPAIARREDRVLALCAKYWPLAMDEAFERTVFLYSRKFGGRYFEVFRAIKAGRARGSSDDEVLSAVAAILTTSYSYSVSGDLYMQIMWRRIRARMEERVVARRLAAPGPVATTRAGPAPAPDSRVRSRRAQDAAESPRSAPPPPSVPPSSRPLLPMPQPARGGVNSGLRAASRSAVPPARRIPAPAPAAAAAASPPSRTQSRAALRPVVAVKSGHLFGRVRPPESVREIRSRHGSVSDSIRKLSGRTYDVHKERFIERVRDHIRRALLASKTRNHGLFDTAANDAEDQVFGFIVAHYDDPFMDWEHSAEREVVEALGFSMPSLQPIIESCFRKL